MADDNNLIPRADARDAVIGWDEGCAMIDAIPAVSTEAAEAYRQGWNDAVRAVTPTLIPLEEPAAPRADVAVVVERAKAALDNLVEVQQDINFAANSYMSQPLCDASAFLDTVETLISDCLSRLAAIEAERDAANARAEKAEARVVTLETALKLTADEALFSEIPLRSRPDDPDDFHKGYDYAIQKARTALQAKGDA